MPQRYRPGHALLEGVMERFDDVVIVDGAHAATDRPCTEADYRDRRAIVAKLALLHAEYSACTIPTSTGRLRLDSDQTRSRQRVATKVTWRGFDGTTTPFVSRRAWFLLAPVRGLVVMLPTNLAIAIELLADRHALANGTSSGRSPAATCCQRSVERAGRRR
jgi:hypothetical protein